MKKLFYSGLMALMMFFAIGTANAQKVTITLGTGPVPEWTLGSEDVLNFVVTITEDEGNTLVLGTAEGNFAVKVGFVANEDQASWDNVIAAHTQVLTAATTPLVTTSFTEVAEYKVVYKLVKGDDNNVDFAGTATLGNNTAFFNVVNDNPYPYTIEFKDFQNGDLSTTEANTVTLNFPAINIKAYFGTGNESMAAKAEIYYVFLADGEADVEPTRDAYNATDNNGKIKKAIEMTSQTSVGGKSSVIYTDDATAKTVKIKAYLTPDMSGIGGFEPLADGDGDDETTEYVTDTYTYRLSFTTGTVTKPAFEPASGEIEQGKQVKISNFDDIFNGDEEGDIWYSVNGKTPLYGYMMIDPEAGILNYNDESGIAIAGNVGDVITIKAINYAFNEAYEMVASEMAVATYTIKAAEVPSIDVTFTPVSGSTVAPGTKIKVEFADLQDDEELDYCWFKSQEEAEATEWAIDWSSGDDPEVYLERGLDKDTLYLKVALVEVDEETLDGTVKGYSVVATYFVDAALADHLIVTPDGTEPVDENDEVTVTVNFGGEEIEGTIVYKWYATMNEANADETLLTTATAYTETAKPVITKAKPVLSVGYKNADGWLIMPVTIEYTFSAFTFNPETGSTVAPGTKITVTAKLSEDQEIDYKWFSSEEEAEAAEWDLDWTSCEDEQPVAVLDPRSAKDKDTLYLKVTVVTVVENADEDGNWKTDVDGYALAMYIVDKALENKLVVVPNGEASVKENDTVTVTVAFGGEEIEGTIVYKWYATVDEANADETLLTTATAYVETAKPVITKAKPVLSVGYKNAEGWVIMPVTIEYTFGEVAVENSELAGVNVYPNPNAGSFNVAVPERARIDIFGLNGAKVMSREVNAGVEAFNLEHSGIYFVRVMAGNKTAVKRVVVR